MELHEQIRIARERLGLTQEQLADKMRVSKTAVINWEEGSVPHKRRLLQLQEVLGITLYVTGTPDPTDGKTFGLTPEMMRNAIAISKLSKEAQATVESMIDLLSLQTTKKEAKEFVTRSGAPQRTKADFTPPKLVKGFSTPQNPPEDSGT